MNSFSKWSKEVEEELILIVKDWLKVQGRTQADLRESLKASSTRMPSLIEALQMECHKGGLPKVAARLCIIEKNWANSQQPAVEIEENTRNSSIDPFDQLDLLIEKIREDCDRKDEITHSEK